MQYYCFKAAWLTLATQKQETVWAEFTRGNWFLPHSLSLKIPLAYFASYRHNSFRLEFFQTRVQAITLLHKNLFSVVLSGKASIRVNYPLPVPSLPLIYTPFGGLQSRGAGFGETGG